MPVAFRDYYAVLGVARDANDAEIKQAFRKLAHRYHPDVAPDKSTADAKFKELNEANEVLSDPEKRRRYDALGEHWEHPERRPGATRGGFDAGAEGAPEFHFEGTGFSDFFERFFGSRGGPGAGFGDAHRAGHSGATFARRGADIEGDLMVTLDEALRGSTRTITLQRIDPRTGQPSIETLRVTIPSGVREAQRIRLAGKGQEGVGGGEPGHLFLRVTFAAHPELRVRDDDLYLDLELAPWEAVLGATVRVPTLDGTVALKVPPGTVAGRRLRLRGKGLPMGDGGRGDLYAIASIQVPLEVTAEQKTLWERLAATATFDPRKTP